MLLPVVTRHVLAASGGFVRDRRGNARPGPLVSHALELSGSARPKFCFVGTATGDAIDYVAQVYAAFSGWSVDVSHLAVFPMPNTSDIRAHLLAQDVIYVGGGSVANLLALWQLHGIDAAMREAWAAGVVMTGTSAGSICWHVGGPTDSFGPDLRPAPTGLALLPYGNGVHYNSEERRRPLLHGLVADGTLPLSYAADDGIGLHYVGTELEEAVADRPDAFAYVIERAPAGTVEERRITPRPLT
jgi:peptidase E